MRLLNTGGSLSSFIVSLKDKSGISTEENIHTFDLLEDEKFKHKKIPHKRIHSLTFQNKKGLSFGLEIADLFGWAHLNIQYGRRYPIKSKTKAERVESRLLKIDRIMGGFYKRRPEDISKSRVKTISGDRVSEFTKKLNDYKAFGLFGDPTR